MTKSWKIILSAVFGLAAALALLQLRPALHFRNFKQIIYLRQPSAPDDKSLNDYYREAQELAKGQNQTATGTFLAVGDIMLSRNVAADIAAAKNLNLPFLGMADVLKSTNFNFANLESPIAPKQPIIGGHSMVFGAPAGSADSLKNYNFQVLNLANNHAFDLGLLGLDFTKSTLDSLNIAHEGTGDTLDQAWTPALASANGIKICFIGASFSSVNDSGKLTNHYVARIEDAAHLQSSINLAKSECDFTVVTMHAGAEYTRNPNLEQTTFAHAAIDDGADLVIGAAALSQLDALRPFQFDRRQRQEHRAGEIFPPADAGFGNGTSFGSSINLTNVTQADADPTAGLIGDGSVPDAPN